MGTEKARGEPPPSQTSRKKCTTLLGNLAHLLPQTKFSRKPRRDAAEQGSSGSVVVAERPKKKSFRLSATTPFSSSKKPRTEKGLRAQSCAHVFHDAYLIEYVSSISVLCAKLQSGLYDEMD